MNLEDLEIYQKANFIADEIWDEVVHWDFFKKDTVGKQMVRSVDSIGANISEGFGRYHYKDRLKFIFYSRGSLYETKTWLRKSKKRKLIAQEKCDRLLRELDILGVKVNNYINTLRKNINQNTNNNK